MLPRVDLGCYATAIWPPFELAAHHRLIVNLLEAVERGEIPRSMIFMPPRHGKTSLGTQIFPAWYLGAILTVQLSLRATAKNWPTISDARSVTW